MREVTVYDTSDALFSDASHACTGAAWYTTAARAADDLKHAKGGDTMVLLDLQEARAVDLGAFLTAWKSRPGGDRPQLALVLDGLDASLIWGMLGGHARFGATGGKRRVLAFL